MLPDPGRPLDPAAIAKSIHDSLDSALTALPPGKDHALLIDASTGNIVEAVYVQRVSQGGRWGDWSVGGAGAWTGQHVSGKVLVMGSW